MESKIVTEEELSNPNLQAQLFPNEVLSSVYWQHRGKFHQKLVERGDSEGITAEISRAARLVVEAEAVLFVTGAGIGVDMGLPDFRTSSAFWEKLNHPEIHRYEDSSDNKWFDEDPDFAWGLNFHQMQMYRSAVPHAGYEAMLELARMKLGNYFCYTSNIDSVLQRVGFETDKVREIHGSMSLLQCTKYHCKNSEGEHGVWSSASVNLSVDPVAYRVISESSTSSSSSSTSSSYSSPRDSSTSKIGEEKGELPTSTTTTTPSPTLPRCPTCGSLARPHVWFCTDTAFVLHKPTVHIAHSYSTWLDRLEESRAKVCVIEIGGGLVIPSARVEAEDVASRCNGSLIRINPVDYMVPVDGEYEAVGIPLGASAAMTRLMQAVKEMV